MPGWRCLTRTRSVARLLAAEPVDIVHSYGIRSDYVNVVSAARALSVTSVREILTQAYLLNYGRLHAAFAARAHPWILKKMDCVIAISEAVQSSLRECGIPEEGIVHIANFVDLSCRRYTRRSTAAHAGNAEAGSHVGYLGVLSSRKRVDRIVRAFATLVHKHPDRRLTLHLAGEGPLREDLARLADGLGVQEKVRFHGFVLEVADFLSTLDLVVLASEMEGIPRALMEAMALGKTCLGPRIGGVDELIEDGRTGYLFDPGCDSDLATKMEQVLMGGRSLDPAVIARHIETRFSAEAGAQKTAEVYANLLADRAARSNRRRWSLPGGPLPLSAERDAGRRGDESAHG
jgi:glycosyltransferase involved in cell wall biosynthesis